MVNVIHKVDEKAPVIIHRFCTDYWEVCIPESKSDDLKKKLEKLVDNRKNWVTPLYEFFIARMTYIKEKDRPVEKVVKALQEFEETVLAIIQKWKEKVKFREESKQKDLSESLGKVKPKKK